MAIDVSEESIRALLDKPAQKSVSTETIMDNIMRCKRLIENVLDPVAKDSVVEDAIRAFAVWLTYGAYMEGITAQFGGISVADQTKLDHYRKVAELFIAQVSRSPLDLDLSDDAGEANIGIPPSVATLTNSDGYSQSTL